MEARVAMIFCSEKKSSNVREDIGRGTFRSGPPALCYTGGRGYDRGWNGALETPITCVSLHLNQLGLMTPGCIRQPASHVHVLLHPTLVPQTDGCSKIQLGHFSVRLVPARFGEFAPMPTSVLGQRPRGCQREHATGRAQPVAPPHAPRCSPPAASATAPPAS